MIYDISPVNNYIGNNTSTVFDFNFYIDDESQLKVYLFDENNVKHLLECDIDYTISDIKNTNGGYITFPIEGSNYEILNENQKLSIELDIPVSQETEFNNSSLLNLESLEYSFDYLTRLIQILKRKISLCVKVEECSDNTPEDLMEAINEANISASSSANTAILNKEQAISASEAAQSAKDNAQEILQETKDVKDEILSCGMFKHNLFDMRVSDYILNDIETMGWAPQGSYVNASDYPDFYDSCISQKNNATQKQLTLSGNNINIYENANGHKFFDITNKTFIDNWLNTYDSANFYGIDTQNERILLPRNKTFLSFNIDTSQFASNEDNVKILYYCVGNTVVQNAQTTVVDMTTSTNDTLPMFAAMCFDFVPNNPSWVKANTKCSSLIYQSCYSTLINARNGTNPSGIKVLDIDDIDDVSNYPAYWIVDQDELVFYTPQTSVNSNSTNASNLYFKVANALENTEITDVGYILDEVDKKFDKSLIKAYIVQTYKKGASWYRKWSDGFLEQGSSVAVSISSNKEVSVSLLVSYPNTNYSLVVQRKNSTNVASGSYPTGLAGEIWSKSKSSFESYCFSGVSRIDWIACGYVS